jgi:hypothetical protein
VRNATVSAVTRSVPLKGDADGREKTILIRSGSSFGDGLHTVCLIEAQASDDTCQGPCNEDHALDQGIRHV